MCRDVYYNTAGRHHDGDDDDEGILRNGETGHQASRVGHQARQQHEIGHDPAMSEW